jgi:hypothetical protein
VATKLTSSSVIRREIRIFGIEKPIVAEINFDGVSLRVKGARKAVFISWLSMAQNAVTPQDVPSFLMGKPLELLKRQAIGK